MRIVLLQLAASAGVIALLVGMDEGLRWACRRDARRRALRRELAGVIGSAGPSPTPESREALAAACREGDL